MVTSAKGVDYLAMRPLLRDFTVTMPRGAAVVYPKDAALIVMGADIFPGATVLEAGAGSGALSCALLRAVGATGRLISYERREDFASTARRERGELLWRAAPGLGSSVGDLVVSLADKPIEAATVDRVILDMLGSVGMRPGSGRCPGVRGSALLLCSDDHSAGGNDRDAPRSSGFTEPEATESLVRSWHVEGLAVRPGTPWSATPVS